MLQKPITLHVLAKRGQTTLKDPLFIVANFLTPKKVRNNQERAALLHALRHWQPYLIGREFILCTDHNPNLALAKGKMKSYDTLTDEILQFMPFKMEFLNGNRMFVDALSRPTNNVLAINLGNGPQCPIIFDDQVIKSLQISDPVLRYSPCRQQLMNSETDCTLTCSVCRLLSKDMLLF